jgi:hypothetical protein
VIARIYDYRTVGGSLGKEGGGSLDKEIGQAIKPIRGDLERSVGTDGIAGELSQPYGAQLKECDKQFAETVPGPQYHRERSSGQHRADLP